MIVLFIVLFALVNLGYVLYTYTCNDTVTDLKSMGMDQDRKLLLKLELFSILVMVCLLSLIDIDTVKVAMTVTVFSVMFTAGNCIQVYMPTDELAVNLKTVAVERPDDFLYLCLKHLIIPASLAVLGFNGI